MTNPTSNFGWQMPTPVDLVTDLPADFEVFGQAVDTSMADLKGGTTGQILSKATNADMDFTWITNDVGDITNIAVTSPITGGGSSGSVTIGVNAASTSASGVVQLSDSTSTTSSVLASTPTATKSAYDLAAAAVPKSTVTTAGDVIYATGSGAVTRLGIGTTGQVLTVNGGGTAPSWATPATPSSFSNNGILNSAFQIWQRGTSLAGVTAINYTADQWQLFRAGSTISRQATGDTTNLPNIQYCARVQRNSGTTGTSSIVLSQSLETLNSIPFAGKTVTLSFYARKGANFSHATSSVNGSIFSGTGTDQTYIAGFTGLATVANSDFTLTTTWQRFTISAPVTSTATELAVNFSYVPSGTAGANDYFEVTGVQLEVGSSATAFHTNQPTIATELTACQRYYARFSANATNNYMDFGFGTAASTTAVEFDFKCPVTMRITPTAVDFSAIAVQDAVARTSATSLNITTIYSGQDNVRLTAGVASGLTQYRPYFIQANASSTAYIGVSAEL
jgi:hypothetical protein